MQIYMVILILRLLALLGMLGCAFVVATGLILGLISSDVNQDKGEDV